MNKHLIKNQGEVNMIGTINEDNSTDYQAPTYSTEPSEDCLNDVIYSDHCDDVEYSETTDKE